MIMDQILISFRLSRMLQELHFIPVRGKYEIVYAFVLHNDDLTSEEKHHVIALVAQLDSFSLDHADNLIFIMDSWVEEWITHTDWVRDTYRGNNPLITSSLALVK